MPARRRKACRIRPVSPWPICCSGIGAAEEIEKGAPTQKCPVCGFTQADFKKTGRLGCSACYVTFAEGLGSLLKAMHKGTEHVGKFPQRAHREDGAERSDADANRKFAESGGGRKLRNGGLVARPDQTAGNETGELKMKFSNVMATGGEWLRGEGPHHQIVVSSRVRLARNLRQPRLSRVGEEGRAHADSRVDQAARRRAAGDAGFIFGIAPGSFRAGKAGAGRAASDQPRARGQKHRAARWS